MSIKLDQMSSPNRCDNIPKWALGCGKLRLTGDESLHNRRMWLTSASSLYVSPILHSTHEGLVRSK